MSKKIMIVDDEKDNIATAKVILEKEGFEISTASNGDECLKKIKGGEKPDLILMDIMMPGTPVRKIVPKLSPIKVAYVSVVRTSEAEKEELLGNKNLVGFIQKPYDIDDLISNVKKFLK